MLVIKAEVGVEIGRRAIFTGYVIPIGDDLPIFRTGDSVVVACIEANGDAMSCILTDEVGNILSGHGDTLFPEEIVPLLYAPPLYVAELAASLRRAAHQ